MSVLGIVLIALFAFDAGYTMARIDQPRAPIEPWEAATSTICATGMILWIVLTKF